jgi:hypothetical protein
MLSCDLKVTMKRLSILRSRLRYLQEPHHLRLLLRPPQYDSGYAQLLVAMSSMQGDINSIQREVRSISTRVEQCQLDIQECLKHHYPDED